MPLKKLYLLIATVFGIGYLPIMPGTYCSLFCCIIYYFFINNLILIYKVLILFLLFFIGIYVSGKVERIIGSKDPRIIVIDEFVGQMIPLFISNDNFYYYIFSFIFFRVLDVFKPFPIKRIEGMKGGLSVVLDDVIAGFYVFILLLIYTYVLLFYYELAS